jgi:hypothetical protein
MSTASRALFPLAVLLLASVAPPRAARAEETVLFYDRYMRTVSHRPTSQGGNTVDSSRAQVLISIGDRRVAFYEPERVRLYDFERRRVLSVDPTKHAYSDWSLHAFVASAETELRSRLALRARMERTRPGSGPPVLELETLFSMSAMPTRPGPREALSDSSRAGHLRFFVNRELAMDAVLSDSGFAPGRARVFGRLLAFEGHLHPRVRAALVGAGRIPQRLSYRFRDLNDERVVVLELTRISSAPEANQIVAGLAQVDIPDPAYAELNDRLAAIRACASSADWIEKSRRFEAAALDSARWLDAELARDERVVGACEAPSTWPPAVDARAAKDSAVAACRAGLAWRDSAGAIAALEGLDRVNGGRHPKAYVIDLLRARARLASGNIDLGSYLMMGGLGGSPCMAGAWLDLAHGYLKTYQPVLAWLCLEAAERADCPNCKTRLGERAELERGLEKRHPDFFE